MSSRRFTQMDCASFPGNISNVYEDGDGFLVVVVRQEYRFRFRGAPANVHGSTLVPPTGRWREANTHVRTPVPADVMSRRTAQSVNQAQFQASAPLPATHQVPSLPNLADVSKANVCNGARKGAPRAVSEGTSDETSRLSSSEQDALGTLLDIFGQSADDEKQKAKKPRTNERSARSK